MSRIVLATASAELEELIHDATGGNYLALPQGPLPLDPSALFAQLNGAPAPEVVVLDCQLDAGQALELAAGFHQQHPQISVVLVSDQGPELALDALRAGVRDIVNPSTDVLHLRSTLDRAAQAARIQAVVALPVQGQSAATGRPAGRVISVVSPKGGVGKTTVATNIAVGLAQTAPNSTVLVDLDIQFGDVASALDLEPEYFLAEAVQGSAKSDSMVLKTFLTQHQTGLYAICAPDSPADADGITSEDVSHLLQTLAAEFRYVVVDTAPGLSEHTLAALDQTSDLVLLTSMDVPGVRGMRKELDTLAQLDMLVERRQVVLNFADNGSLLSVADVEVTIGASVDLELPRSKAAITAVNQGVPLLQSGVKDPLTKQLRKLVERLVAAGGQDLLPVEAVPLQIPVEAKAVKVHPKRAASRWRRTRQVVA
ncbi:AAA family ATPase [Microlunatus panaciterrae]|uniref:Pilus assembly protein CpaE n=1 Tax=Microlunatus panaciterrae TaxID=400768 RepID=A0ABS2RLT2_9ACTN|nr:AAA family ATPase [Microlunatus panaciterrae]MBM7799974.1 pilus assembly protein CpaE [Microlunatus panaciterrae]